MLPDFTRPDASSCFYAICAIDALNHNERQTAQYMASLVGGNLLIFRVNKKSIEVDMSVTRVGHDVFIAMYGTENLEQAFRELSSLQPSYRGSVGGYVGAFFFQAAREVEDYLDQRIFAHGATPGRIVIVGHSLGGAVAYLYGLLLKEKGYGRIEIMTFGEPKSISNRIGLEVNSHIRVIAGDQQTSTTKFDPVPFLPPDSANYLFLGRPYAKLLFGAGKFVVGTTPVQHGEEFWYQIDGTAIPSPFDTIQRWFNNFFRGAWEAALMEFLTFHYIDTSYLPMCFGRYAELQNKTFGRLDDIAIRWIFNLPTTEESTLPERPLTPDLVPAVVARRVIPVLSNERILRQRQLELLVATAMASGNSIRGIDLTNFQGVPRMQVPNEFKAKVADYGNGFYVAQVGNKQLATFSSRGKCKTFCKKTNQYFNYFDRTSEITLEQFVAAWTYLLQGAAAGGVDWQPNPGITLV